MAETAYISLYGRCGRIHIFKSTLKALGHPKYLRFKLNADGRILIEPYDRITLTSFRVPEKMTVEDSMEISTKAFITATYKEFNLDRMKSYRIEGKIYSKEHIVIFDMATAVVLDMRK